MARQKPSIPSMIKVSDLIGRVSRGEYILQPEFQRRLVWNDGHKKSFIDTILKGYPFPEIFLAQTGVDLEILQAQQVVVDGQQRLSTIINYVEGKIGLNWRDVPSFANLSNEEKTDFLNYNIVVRDLQDATEEDIKEIFRRINRTKFSLQQVEIQNAVYDGQFISTAKELSVSLQLDTLPVFGDAEVSRMGDLHFLLMVMATIEEGGYFSGKGATETAIQRYDDSYPNAVAMKTDIAWAIEFIKRLNLREDSMWFRKSNFFTLVVELIANKTIVQEKGTDLIGTALLSFEENVLDNKLGDNEYARYYKSMYTGTDSRTARVYRGGMVSGLLRS